MNNTNRSRDEKESNPPYDEFKLTRVKTRIWVNSITAREAELVADFRRRTDWYTTRSYSEWELLEISVLAKKAWKVCRRHRRRQAMWSWFRRSF